MPLFRENKALKELSGRLLSGMSGNISKLDYEPQKTTSADLQDKDKYYFERVTPESVGISSLYVSDFITDLKKAAGDLHHILMLRHGKAFAASSFAPYLSNTIHIQHGIAKSITSLAIGMLFDEGKLFLNSKMTDIFGSAISFLNSMKLKNMTVHHLLTQTSGTSFNTAKAAGGNDWLSLFFDAPLTSEPGTVFEYNSMNSYILSAIVTRITGMPMDEYLKKKLFDPLHISGQVWERCPRGITKGGWGLYLKTEDLAKIAMLYLNKGLFEEKRIVSEKWIEACSKPYIETGNGHFSGYGYNAWTGSKSGDLLFSGMFLQQCYILCENDMIIVINSGSGLNCESRVKEIVDSYFGGAYKTPSFLVENPASNRILNVLLSKNERRSLGNRHIKGGWGRSSKRRPESSSEYLKDKINDLSYVLENRTYGIMPSMMQQMHNNLSEGLSEISFEKDSKGLIIHLREGDTINNLALGLTKDRYSVMDFKGEQYLVSGLGSFAEDEDGDICLKIEAVFVEEACRRFIKIFFKNGFNRIKIELSETPADIILDSMQGDPSFDLEPVIKGHRKNLYENIGENVLWARP